MTQDMKIKNEKFDFLNCLFPNEDFKKIVYFSCCFEEMLVEKDYILYNEGDLIERLYLILKGEVKVICILFIFTKI
jgi:hypothetical protein